MNKLAYYAFQMGFKNYLEKIAVEEIDDRGRPITPELKRQQEMSRAAREAKLEKKRLRAEQYASKKSNPKPIDMQKSYENQNMRSKSPEEYKKFKDHLQAQQEKWKAQRASAVATPKPIVPEPKVVAPEPVKAGPKITGTSTKGRGVQLSAGEKVLSSKASPGASLITGSQMADKLKKTNEAWSEFIKRKTGKAGRVAVGAAKKFFK